MCLQMNIHVGPRRCPELLFGRSGKGNLYFVIHTFLHFFKFYKMCILYITYYKRL